MISEGATGNSEITFASGTELPGSDGFCMEDTETIESWCLSDSPLMLDGTEGVSLLYRLNKDDKLFFLNKASIVCFVISGSDSIERRDPVIIDGVLEFEVATGPGDRSEGRDTVGLGVVGDNRFDNDSEAMIEDSIGAVSFERALGETASGGLEQAEVTAKLVTCLCYSG